MKQICFLLLLFMVPVVLLAQQNQWMWVNGRNITDEYSSEYGITGVDNNENWPHGRSEASAVVDPEGHFWLFGGFSGYDNGTSELWSYVPANNNWNFKKGKYLANNSPGYSKGLNIEHYRNYPGDRRSAAIWASGNYIYLFSGNKEASVIAPDFWRYNRLTNNWEQLYQGELNSEGHFGMMGVESELNTPPPIYDATTWTDSQGNLWLFGGYLYNTYERYYNALWKYNITSKRWVWVSGSQSANVLGTYFLLGGEHVGNLPGARICANGWIDAAGNICIYGGYGPLETSLNGTNISSYWKFNDTWKFNPQTLLWTWVKGSQSSVENIASSGTENPANMPAGVGRDDKLCSWKDLNGNFWLYEGSNLDKLWKYNPASNNWVLVKNILLPSSDGKPIYGFLNVPDPQNTPGRRVQAAAGTGSDGKLYLYSGEEPYGDHRFNDQWSYDITTGNWIWIKGCSDPLECPQKQKMTGSSEIENTPGLTIRYGAKWQDNAGNLWLYSNDGAVYSSGNTTSNTHLWEYHSSTNQWQWKNGLFSEYNSCQPSYGVLGTESSDNLPGARFNAMSWSDQQGNLWMFGGEVTTAEELHNDLWKYNTTSDMWVWIGGTQPVNQQGIYGTQGVTAATNQPGARSNGRTWVDAEGNFWLFGGKGYGTSTTKGDLNDLWKYSIVLNQWVWVKGSNVTGSTGYSSGINTVNVLNSPPSGNYVAGWPGNPDGLWLYNGAIWKFDIAQNSWIHKKNSNAILQYGAMGMPAATNSPGNRRKVTTWYDADGNLWLLGGECYFDFPGEYLLLNDLWKYDITSTMWAWVGGTQTKEALAHYGIMNVPNYYNIPGSRKNAVSWSDDDGNLMLFGGQGFGTYWNGGLNDLWTANRKFNSISGKVQFDMNNNGCTSSPIVVDEIKIKIQDGSTNSINFTSLSGDYQLNTQYSQVTLMPEVPYFNASPPLGTFNFNGYGNTAVQDFCLSPSGTHNDLELAVFPVTQARPGFSDAKYKIVYKNKGTTILSGSVIFTYDDSRMDFISTTQTPINTSPGSITWNYTGLQPFESNSIQLTMKVNSNTGSPPVFAGDTLVFSASVSPLVNDETPEDNTSTLVQSVLGALNPNDKTCSEGEIIAVDKLGQYLHYLVRFENIGTANAINVIVNDSMEASSFDMNSIVPVSSDHNYRMSVSENHVVTFFFDNINLPSSGANQYGYILFKTKSANNLNAGDSILNKAGIYFDYNLPVITNQASIYIANPITGLVETLPDSTPLISPNPFTSMLNFNQINVTKIELYDLNGRMVLSSYNCGNNIDLEFLHKGLYLVKLFFGNKTFSAKVFKE